MDKKTNKHIVIFSHGFGVRKDDRGLHTNIAQSLPEVESVLFDYNTYNEKENTLTIALLSVQAEMLASTIKEVRTKNPDAIIDLICHSQGCLVAGMAYAHHQFTGIRKVVFTAPALDVNVERSVSLFRDRPGTVIDLEGITRLARRDGSVSIVSAEFWEERRKFHPVPLYNALSEAVELIIIRATEDEVLAKTDTSELSPLIKIIDIPGNHSFGGTARELLLKKIREYLL